MPIESNDDLIEYFKAFNETIDTLIDGVNDIAKSFDGMNKNLEMMKIRLQDSKFWSEKALEEESK